jgi:hypothetical protein
MKWKVLNQTYDLQNLAHDGIIAIRTKVLEQGGIPTVEDTAKLSQLAKVWETAVERARIIRGKPLPGSLRPEKKAKRQLGPMTVLPMDEILPESGNSSVAGGA